MELRDYFSVFRSHVRLIVGIALVSVLATLGLRYVQPAHFDVSQTMTISRVNVQNTQVYKFDDYYALQASDIFTRTISGWLSTPAFVVDIYNEARMQAPQDISALTRFITASKLSQQVLQVQFSYGNADDAQKISDALVKVVQRETDKQNALTKDTANFHIEATDPVIVQASKRYTLFGGASLLVGLFIGYCLSLLLYYLNKSKKA